MNTNSDIEKFEELQAGYILGDLTPEEENTLVALCSKLGRKIDADSSLAFTMAAFEGALSSPDPASEAGSGNIPVALRARILEDVSHSLGPRDSILRPDFSKSESDDASSGQSASKAERILSLPFWSGWAAAVLVLCFWIGSEIGGRVNMSSSTQSGTANPVTELVSALEKLENVQSAPIDGLGSYVTMNGRYVWSDQFQQGYMELEGLPVNNPEVSQYQLWIVDPARDADAPVDGGVFDIAESGKNIIPIDAKLKVNKPVAFVITLEQPGGVVKSRQEIVVGIGKAPDAA